MFRRSFPVITRGNIQNIFPLVAPAILRALNGLNSTNCGFLVQPAGARHVRPADDCVGVVCAIRAKR